MGLFKSRRQRIVEIYKQLQAKASDGFDLDAESVISQYPKLELVEAIFVAGCLERGMSIREFDDASKKLGRNLK